MEQDRPLGERDSVPREQGDLYFVGVDERLYPPQLQPGYVASAKNYRFRNGRAEPRLGDAICLWSWNGGHSIYLETYCCAQFANPDDGLEWVVVAGNIGGTPAIFALRPNNDGKLLTVTLPAGAGALSAATCVQLVQCMNVLVLLRGANEAPLVCMSLDEGFKGITQSAAGTGTVAIPNSGFGLYYKNRLLVISGRDDVAVSDALDYTRYVPVLSEFKINRGNNDALVAIAAFTDSTLIMLKDQSVLRVDNVYGDLSSVRLGEVTNEYGCVSPWSVTRMGSDLVWLSEKGIVTLRLTELNQIQSTQEILSAPMEKTMARVNWAYASGRNGGSGAVAAYWDGKLYMALPLDEAELKGVELAAGSYSGGGTASVSTTAGLTYRYAQGANDTSVTNGTETVPGDSTFVAQGATVTLNGTAAAAVTASVKQVIFSGVNNHVLVYDTLNKAWCGYDTRSPSDSRFGMNVHRWVQFTYQDRIRLGYFDRYGYMRLYEEGFEDDIANASPVAMAQIYVAQATPTDADTVSVNAGTLVTVNTGFSTNLGDVAGVGRWGVAGGYARDNIWADRNAVPGYKQALASPWTAPNTTPSQKDWGMLFLATNGSTPVVRINGTIVSSAGFYGTNEWAYVDYGLSGSAYTTVAVETELVTRGYRWDDAGQKRLMYALCGLSTWAPSYTIRVLTEGFEASVTRLSAQTRSRTQYDYPKGKAAWDETNVNDDWGTRGRQDYSVVPDAVLGTGLGTGEGINFDQHQTGLDRLNVGEEGSWAQLKLTNTSGRLEVNMVRLLARSGPRTAGVAAN